jgi:hypothetical protein
MPLGRLRKAPLPRLVREPASDIAPGVLRHCEQPVPSLAGLSDAPHAAGSARRAAMPLEGQRPVGKSERFHVCGDVADGGVAQWPRIELGHRRLRIFDECGNLREVLVGARPAAAARRCLRRTHRGEWRNCQHTPVCRAPHSHRRFAASPPRFDPATKVRVVAPRPARWGPAVIAAARATYMRA